METITRTLVLFHFISFLFVVIQGRPTRWCVTSSAEEIKCKQLKKEIDKALLRDKSLKSVLPDDFQCVRDYDLFLCMRRIENNVADLMTLDSGLGYFAGRQHNMMPIMAEQYGPVTGPKPTYYAIALTRATNFVTFESLRAKKICFPGIGMSAGWIYPVGQLLKNNHIEVSQCNAIVKAVSTFFKDICLPGALSSFYNPFGNNPTSVCKLCKGQNEEFCMTSDRYGGYDGAFECVANGDGDLAFVRHDTVEAMTGSLGSVNSSSDYKIFCPDGRMSFVGDYLNCNWGEVSSNVIMTSAVRDPIVLESYKKYLLTFEKMWGPQGTHKNDFQLFTSESRYNADLFNTTLHRKNLLFNDMTTGFFDIGDYIYNTWVGDRFTDLLNEMSRCPSEPIRWCVISMAEKLKCEAMLMAFKAKSLKPDLDCMYGGNTTYCLEMITRGDADLINLDAGDIYVAGKKYGLVPIAAEDYGDMTMEFKVVAVARKTDKSTTLFNMKGKRSCQPGIGRGDGWIVPLNIFIETEQFLPEDCSAFKNIGELFVRSCIPGALDSEYNPSGKPINLCEGCAAGGYRKCRRDSEEQYYGASGAFRCLVEKGGDVSFVRHLTVRDNTDGRNHAIWARNRRSDDYEIMCKDGRRLNIDRFEECHLGYIPSNAIVTSSGKEPVQKEIIWNLINYGQQFFSSDIDGDFHMFDSGLWYTDLLFTDAAVRLMKIPEEKQNYKAWLGESFIAQIENLEKYTCVSPGSASYAVPSLILLITAALISKVLS